MFYVQCLEMCRASGARISNYLFPALPRWATFVPRYALDCSSFHSLPFIQAQKNELCRVLSSDPAGKAEPAAEVSQQEVSHRNQISKNKRHLRYISGSQICSVLEGFNRPAKKRDLPSFLRFPGTCPSARFPPQSAQKRRGLGTPASRASGCVPGYFHSRLTALIWNVPALTRSGCSSADAKGHTQFNRCRTYLMLRLMIWAPLTT